MDDSNPLPVVSEIDLLKQILDVLQNSTIADERGQNERSRFWAAYKKVSSEYDGDMLERCNGNMDIVLIFAGLFSAVNTAFIISMQPNPVDTTNALLVQLIQTLNSGSSAVQPTTFSASTGNSSAYAWTRVLSYMSLAFSLLAAFGAVLGKQWLGYYKTNCYGRGPLEARCKQRHRKFQKLQYWRFENVLYSFPVLIQISLLLFALSLGAAMWAQYQAISILIFATTGLGVLCHIITIAISVVSPDCPFQTPVSLAIQAIIRYFRKRGDFQPLDDGDDSTTSAMQWVLETSTNLEVARPVVELMRTQPNVLVNQSAVNITSLCEKAEDMFKACFDSNGLALAVHQDHALEYGQVLMHLSWNNDEARCTLQNFTRDKIFWRSWRALYLPWVLKRCLYLYNQMKERDDAGLWQRAQADLRNALRMTVAIGMNGFTYPDDERLIWDDQFRLHSFKSEEEKEQFIGQLLKYVKHFHDVGDFKVAGDALLIASGITATPLSDPGLFSNSSVVEDVVHTINSLPSASVDPRWDCVVLGVVRRFLNCDAYSDFHAIASQAVLNALCSPADLASFADDQYGLWFTNATRLFSLNDWPEDHHLKHTQLPKIRHLALLALRRLHKPEVDDAQYILYCCALSRLMAADNHPDLRSFAIHTASSHRQELARIDVAGFHRSQQDTVLSELSPALLSVAVNSSIPMDLIKYLHLISTLVRNHDWCIRFIVDGHVNRCTALIATGLCEEACFYLANFFLRIAPPKQDIPCGPITNEEQWLLTKMAWRFIGNSNTQIDDDVDIIPTLVKSTEISMQLGLSEDDLRLFRDCIGDVVRRLQHCSSSIISEVTRLKDMVEDSLKRT